MWNGTRPEIRHSPEQRGRAVDDLDVAEPEGERVRHHAHEGEEVDE